MSAPPSTPPSQTKAAASDDDDDDTIEFSIEIVSSSSSASSVADVFRLDEENGKHDGEEDLPIVEIEQQIQVPQEEEQQISKCQIEIETDCDRRIVEQAEREDVDPLGGESADACPTDAHGRGVEAASQAAAPVECGDGAEPAEQPPPDASLEPTVAAESDGTVTSKIPEASGGENEEEKVVAQTEQPFRIDEANDNDLTCEPLSEAANAEEQQELEEPFELAPSELANAETEEKLSGSEEVKMAQEPVGELICERLELCEPAQVDVVQRVQSCACEPLEGCDAPSLEAATQELPPHTDVGAAAAAAQEVAAQPQVDILIESADLPSSPPPSPPPPQAALEKRRRSSCASILQIHLQLATLTSDEDLEREFDEEPEFERRQVDVRRHCNVRSVYSLGDELGRGRFGTVFRCKELESGRELAAKFVHMRRKEDREDVEREVAIMSVLQHKRLLQLYDAFDDGQSEMCLITELVEGGELFERIVDDDFELTEKKAAIFMRQICEGVEYMQSENIVHLDMKPENILCLSRTCNRIKLIDFGLARRLDPNEPLRVMFGTPDFAAPEVLGYETVTLATDMWSVGVICYVLLSGLSPFMGDTDLETMANVTRATFDFDDSSFEPITELAKDFISKLLVKEPEKRLKPSECLQHAWLQRGGAKLDAAVRERRESIASLGVAKSPPVALNEQTDQLAAAAASGQQEPLDDMQQLIEPTGSGAGISLNKRNLKKYVVRRKWHKTVHAIMALGRMGANLKIKLPPTAFSPGDT